MSYNFTYTINPSFNSTSLGYFTSGTKNFAIASGTQYAYLSYITVPIGTYIYNLSGFFNTGFQATGQVLVVQLYLVTYTTTGGITTETFALLNTTYGIAAYNDPTNTSNPYPNDSCYPLNMSMTIENTINPTSTTTYTYVTKIYSDLCPGPIYLIGTFVGVIQMTRIA